MHQGNVVYEWDQNLQEVNVYVKVPPGVRAKQLYVELRPRNLRLGIQSQSPYLEVRLYRLLLTVGLIATVNENVAVAQVDGLATAG